MALQIIIAVRNARQREVAELGADSDVLIVHGSREHTDLMAVITTKATQTMLGEDGLAKADTEANVASAGLSYVVRADRLLQRLQLEHHMMNVAVKLPLFAFCVMCFLWAISLLSPAEGVSTVHRQLITHFDVTKERFDGMVSFHDVYDFIADFESANQGLQASSAQYWCEKRYFEHTWNAALLLPERSCPSPRLAALGFETDAPTTWTDWAFGGSSSAAYRRLAEEVRASLTGASHPAAVPPCEDNDMVLQLEEGDPSITCENSASHTCEIDLGVMLCPKTCGYCAPFEYEHSAYFDGPQVTMLPVMVHQTRFGTKYCENFAHTFAMQPHNRDLVTLPPLDGDRRGRVLTCVDRLQHVTDEFAFQLECPDGGAPEGLCTNGTMPFSKIHTYHGVPVYAQFLTEPTKNLAAMRAMDWLDAQTESVTVSTLVYTEQLEIFTSISATFDIDPPGNILGNNAMVSYTDLTQGKRAAFIALLVFVCVGSCAGMAISVWQLVTSHCCKWGMQTFELLSRSVMGIYALVLLIGWSTQIPMAEEYDHLLHSVLDLHGRGHEDFEELVQTYFDANMLIYEQTQWLMSHRVTIYIILYLQFAQLIAYFAVHPRLAMLTSTIAGAVDHMFHFFMLFVVIYLFMAFIASWMLGGDVHAFQTFSETLASQGRMLFGEWIYADNADDLHGAMLGMYWVFAITFALILFFTLLNFFLAIVVESFVVVKNSILEDPIEQNIVPDIVDMFGMSFRFRRQGWGTHSALSKSLQEALKEQGGTDTDTSQVWHVRQLMDILPPDAKNAEALSSFLRYYAAKCPSIVTVDDDAKKSVRAMQPSQCADVRTRRLDEVLQEASRLLRPAVQRALGEFSEPTWSYEQVRMNGQVVHRVSANFLRELQDGEPMRSAAEIILGSTAAEGRPSQDLRRAADSSGEAPPPRGVRAATPKGSSPCLLDSDFSLPNAIADSQTES